MIHESGENYLEAILILEAGRDMVRSIDLAEQLGVSKPSVSRAVSILRGEGYLDTRRDGALELTAAGRALAVSVYERHKLLTRFLTALGVSEATAAEDACRMEHVISPESFEKLKKHAEEYMDNM